jgi:HlyD family secretion protein
VPKQVVPRGARSVGEVLCSINNDKLELLPNVNVEVRILVHELHQVLVIPRGSVNSDAAGHFVWVCKEGVVNRRNITIGIASASNYEVVSGLTLGEQVVERTEDDMHDGMKVRPAEAK